MDEDGLWAHTGGSMCLPAGKHAELSASYLPPFLASFFPVSSLPLSLFGTPPMLLQGGCVGGVW